MGTDVKLQCFMVTRKKTTNKRSAVAWEWGRILGPLSPPALAMREVQKYEVDIACLSEVRIADISYSVYQAVA